MLTGEGTRGVLVTGEEARCNSLGRTMISYPCSDGGMRSCDLLAVPRLGNHSKSVP